MSDKSVLQGAFATAVEDQRQKLLNVLGVAQCVKVAVGSNTSELPDLDAALALVEEQLQSVVTGLERLSLQRAAGTADL